MIRKLKKFQWKSKIKNESQIERERERERESGKEKVVKGMSKKRK